MSYTSKTKHEIRTDLRRFMRGEAGNWRFKGLLLAALTDDAEAVGEAWPTSDRWLSAHYKNHPGATMDRELSLASRPEGSAERTLARETFGKDAVEAGETVPIDKYIKRSLTSGRALLSDSATELDTLWREQLLETVIMGAEPVKMARDAATVVPVSDRKGDIPRGEAQSYAEKIARGGVIPDDGEDFDTIAYDCEKYGQGFRITDELLELAVPSVLERQVRFAGAAVENAMNRRWLTEMVDNAGNTADADIGTTDLTPVQALNEGITQIELDDFGPATDVVYHPEFAGALYDDTNLVYANRAGSDDVIRNRSFNQVLGLMQYRASNGAYDPDGSATWGYNANGEVGSFVYQKDMSALVVWKDIETKDYDDPIRDLVGGNARAHFDAKVLQPNAVANVTY